MVDRHRQVKKSVAYLCQSNGCNDNGDAPINIISSRRRILFQVATTLSILSTNPSLSFAAAPITSKEADNFQAKLQRLLRPKPPKALRPKLDQDFAVLLMRSSYNALDQLDVVAMVRFWVIFFLGLTLTLHEKSLLTLAYVTHALALSGPISTRFLSHSSSRI